MKQKMVLKVTMSNEKSRSRALKIAVGLSGVESASLKGDDKSEIEVTGDEVDPVKLTSLLKKGVGHAELMSVTAVGGEKKEEKKEDEAKVPYVCPYNQPLYVCQEVPYDHQKGPCSIM